MATEADRAFARRTHHLAYRDVVERQFGPWVEEEQDGFFESDWVAKPHEIILSNGEPWGYVCVEDRPADVHLRELVLAPEYQGRGIGTAVLGLVTERARARGVPVRLGTHLANRAANLYRRVGFRQIGTTDTHLLFEWSADENDLDTSALQPSRSYEKTAPVLFDNSWPGGLARER